MNINVSDAFGFFFQKLGQDLFEGPVILTPIGFLANGFDPLVFPVVEG